MFNSPEASNALDRQAYVSPGKQNGEVCVTFCCSFWLTCALSRQTYNFYVVNYGIDKQSSMLRARNARQARLSGSSFASNSAQEGRLRRRLSTRSDRSLNGLLSPPNDEHLSRSSDTEVDVLEKSMSALRFVPTAVTKNRR